jgi:predicted nucleotidyltransferase
MEKWKQPKVVIPPGMRVVTRVGIPEEGGRPPRAPGAVGVVVRAPGNGEADYRVRFPGGQEFVLPPRAIRPLRHYQGDALEPAADPAVEAALRERIIYRCVVGSRAYGLDEAGSDTDRRGIYLAPPDIVASLAGAPEQIEDPETEECYWELKKFLILALKANPNALECLYTPLVEMATPLARELLGLRDAFLSKLVYQTFNGYVISEFKRLDRAMRLHGTLKWKHPMHLIRMLLSGLTILREGFVPLRVDAHRDRLLAIRRGELTWADVNAWRLELHKAFDEAFEKTRLPEKPDYRKMDAFLIRARREAT